METAYGTTRASTDIHDKGTGGCPERKELAMAPPRTRMDVSLRRYLGDFARNHDSPASHRLVARKHDVAERMNLNLGPGTDLDATVYKLEELCIREFDLVFCPHPGTWDKPREVDSVGAIVAILHPQQPPRSRSEPPGALSERHDHRESLRRLATQQRKGVVPPPNYIVDDGSCLQVTWLLRPTQSSVVELAVERVQLELARRLKGAEPVPAAETFLKLPGAVNWGNPGGPTPNRAVQYFPKFRYQISQFPMASRRAWANQIRPSSDS